MPDLTATEAINETATNFRELVRFYSRVLRRGWRLIALLIAVCLTLAAIYLTVAVRMYAATAQFLILQQGGRPLSVASNDANQIVDRGDDYVPTQALIVGSPRVVGQAIESVGLEHLPTLAAAQRKGFDPVEQAIDQLAVDRPERQAKILRVTYRARSREEAIRTVEAIAASYQKFLEDSFQRQNDETIGLISRACNELSTELEQCQERYREFRQKNRTLVADEHGRSLISARLEQLYRAASDARTKEIQLKAQLALGQRLARQGTGLWAIAHAVEQSGSGPSSSWIANAAGVNSGMAQDYMHQLSQEQQRLTERYGPENAKVQLIKEQIQRVQEGAHHVRRRLELGEVQDLLVSYEEGLKSLVGMQAEFKHELDDALVEFKEIEDKLLIEANLRDRMERRRSLFNTVVDQLKQAQFVSNYSSINSQVVEPPHSLRRAVSPRVGMTLGLALVAGIVLGLIAALVAEFMSYGVNEAAHLPHDGSAPSIRRPPPMGCPSVPPENGQQHIQGGFPDSTLYGQQHI